MGNFRHLGVLSLVALGACTPRSETEENCHWIGSINPLTGALGPVGLALENAAKLAVQDVNRAGLVAGKTLCIATGDDRTNADRAAKVVDALVKTHGIIAVNGSAASGSTLKAAEAAKLYELPIVSCCSTSPDLSSDPYIYRTVPSDALQAVALAKLAIKLGAKRAAIIYDDNSYGNALRGAFEGAFVGDDRTITKAIPFLERQASYSGVVAQALEPAPDFAVLLAYPVEGAQIVRDWRTNNVAPNVKWLGTDGLKDDGFILSLGTNIPEFQGTAPSPSGRYYRGFEARYREAFGGEAPGIYTANQYDAVLLIALGLARAGAIPDAMELRKTIRAKIPEISRPGGTAVNADDLVTALRAAEAGDVDYVGASGDVDLDENGDVITGYGVWTISGSGIVDTPTCFRCEKASPSAGVNCSEEACGS